MTIPKVTLTCMAAYEGTLASKCPADVHIAEIAIAKDNVSEVILTIIVILAQNFVFYTKPTTSLTTTMTFSSKQGLEFDSRTDPKIIDVYKKYKNPPAALVQDPKIQPFIDMLKKVPKPKDELSLPSEHRGKPVVYVDETALLLINEGIVEPVTIEVRIDLLMKHSTGGPTTGSLRFPHMLQSILKRYENVLDSPKTKVCIAGPGLKDGKCPQFVEFHAVFPNASFLILENDPAIIQAIDFQLKKQCLFYDLAVLRGRSFCCAGIDASIETPATYKPLIKLLIKNLQSQAKNKAQCQMIEGCGQLNTLLVDVDAAKVELRNFDLGVSEFKGEDEETFDLVIGTCSISAAVDQQVRMNSAFNPEHTIKKYLSLLKDGGTFYTETPLIDAFNQKGVSWKTLEESLNSTISFEEINFGDLLPNTTTKHGQFPNPTIPAMKVMSIETINTVHITGITRKIIKK